MEHHGFFRVSGEDGRGFSKEGLGDVVWEPGTFPKKFYVVESGGERDTNGDRSEEGGGESLEEVVLGGDRQFLLEKIVAEAGWIGRSAGTIDGKGK